MLITVIQNPALSKVFSLKDGKLEKKSAANLAVHNAIVVDATLEMVGHAVNAGNCTVILGYPPNTQHLQNVKLLSKKIFKELHGDQSQPIWHEGLLTCTRTKEVMQQAPFIVMDFDINAYVPNEFRSLTPQQYIQLLATVFTFFATAGYVANYSCSAGIYDANGLELKPLCGFHIYFKVKDANDIERFLNALWVRLILAGIYWNHPLENGAIRVETLFDKVANSRERLVFEVLPILHDNLVRHAPAPIIVDGNELDTASFPDLTADELRQYQELTGNSGQLASKSTSPAILHSHAFRDYDNTTLTPETVLTQSNGNTITVKDFYESDQERLPIYAIGRVDNNPSAFIAKHQNIKGVVFVRDSALRKTYFCTVQEQTKRFANADLTLETYQFFFALHGIRVIYDVIKKDITVNIPNVTFLPENEKNAVIAVLLSLMAREGLKGSDSRLSKYITAIADINNVNPVKTWITSKKWDGVDRFKALCDCLVTSKKYDQFKVVALMRWLIGCVASAMSRDGVKNEIIFVLCGPQGVGKTSFFLSLVPENSEWIRDGVSLNPQDKDSVKQVVSYWIIELGEIDATFKKADIAALKAFCSMRSDELRLPYAPSFSKYPRRTAFCASVNTSNYLVDDTGNRRFSTIEVTEIKHHNLDIQQLWAQIYELYESGEKWWYTPDEAAMQADINSEHQVIEPLEEMLETIFDFKKPANALLTPTEVMQKLGYQKPSRSEVTKLGGILKQKKLEKVSKKYKMPPLKDVWQNAQVTAFSSHVLPSIPTEQSHELSIDYNQDTFNGHTPPCPFKNMD